jgi:hypothetical protein
LPCMLLLLLKIKAPALEPRPLAGKTSRSTSGKSGAGDY